jgi:hypothetical protein
VGANLTQAYGGPLARACHMDPGPGWSDWGLLGVASRPGGCGFERWRCGAPYARVVNPAAAIPKSQLLPCSGRVKRRTACRAPGPRATYERPQMSLLVPWSGSRRHPFRTFQQIPSCMSRIGVLGWHRRIHRPNRHRYQSPAAVPRIFYRRERSCCPNSTRVVGRSAP